MGTQRERAAAQPLAASRNGLRKHHGLVPIDQHPVFEMSAYSPGEHHCFKIAAKGREPLNVVAVTYVGGVLTDNRAFV